MPTDIWHSGRAAAPGLAIGPLFELPDAATAHRQRGAPSAEAEDLRAAIEQAIADIAALQEIADGEAVDILEFQVAMLSDEALAEGAFAEIDTGTAADIAWRQALDAQVADYSAAEDEYFRARAADLADIRDRVLGHLLGIADLSPPPGAIVLARDLPPSRFLSWDWSKGGGVALTGGSPTSHVAMLARARGVPMVVGLALPAGLAGESQIVLLDGEAGRVRVAPDTTEIAEFERRRSEAREQAAQWQEYLLRPAVTARGERVLTQINVAEPAELDDLDPRICDGIGLVRTEFLFHGQTGLPDEDQQYAVYRRIVAWAAGRPVTIRTLDAGGDKPIPGLTQDAESNPFLGLRGIRLSLAHPDVFRKQLRALARAAAAGPLKIMLPMVTVPEEIAAAAELLRGEIAVLEKDGIACRMPELGIMVEVPAAALAVERYPAAFFSIGSNDLTQYVTAAARDIASVAGLNDTTNPAVLALIERVARFGRESGRDVSLCGDAGGDPRLIPLLLERGVRNLSMAPAMLARAKALIAQWPEGVA
ncbi:phosphoenolpyruvate--protein phosphotransferase [Dongia sp.]|uniref:phosphoenolpyruvate--protein phosphotransferase n=1 Tax=Dongia sp. TaxID=1977262 RepID=UPI0035AF7516